MPKRFTITEKWEDSWFSELCPIEKLVWNYLCDKCDLAGFWEINTKLASFQIRITKSRFLAALQGVSRGYITNDKYLWLRRFIEHQGNLPLNPKNNAHKHIIALLERHTDFDVDFFKEIKTAKVAPEEVLNSTPSKDISNGKGKGNGKGKYSVDFEKFWDAYPRKIGKGKAWDIWKRDKPTVELLKIILNSVAEHKETEQWQGDGGKFIPHPSTFLRQWRWEDDVKIDAPPVKKEETTAEQFERLKKAGEIK